MQLELISKGHVLGLDLVSSPFWIYYDVIFAGEDDSDTEEEIEEGNHGHSEPQAAATASTELETKA